MVGVEGKIFFSTQMLPVQHPSHWDKIMTPTPSQFSLVWAVVVVVLFQTRVGCVCVQVRVCVRFTVFRLWGPGSGHIGPYLGSTVPPEWWHWRSQTWSAEVLWLLSVPCVGLHPRLGKEVRVCYLKPKLYKHTFHKWSPITQGGFCEVYPSQNEHLLFIC